MILFSTNKKVHQTFIGLEDKYNLVHNYKYDYTYTVYRGISTKLCIRCNIHGDFYQFPGNHLKGHGCSKCARSTLPQSLPSTLDAFISKANMAHKGKYDYSKFIYVNARVKGIITCSVHGDFTQSPDNHARAGNGCPRCKGMWIQDNHKNKRGILYIIKLDASNLYKIGITSSNISTRNRFIKEPYSIVLEYVTPTMQEAYVIEQYLLAYYKNFRYVGNKLLKSGNTELVTYIDNNILDVINKIA